MMRKMIVILSAVMLFSVMIGCAKTGDQAADAGSESVPKVETTVAEAPEGTEVNAETAEPVVTIGMQMQTYGVGGEPEVQEGIVEIPEFKSDIECAAVDQLNEQIEKDLMPIYEQGMEDGNWPEIMSYVYSDENYEQVITTGITYPNYGTDGEVFSYVYSKADQSMVTLADAVLSAGTTEEELKQKITEAYETLETDMELKEVNVAAFRYTKDGVHFYANLTAYAEGADDWKWFGEFCPKDNTLMMNGDIHFADGTDGTLKSLDPPLYYDQDTESAGDLGEELGFNEFGESIYMIQMFAKDVQNLIQTKDMTTLAYSVSYPITIQVAGKDQTFEKAGDLAEVNFDDVFSAETCEAVLAEDPENLFTNGEGTMLGNGAIWFALCDVEMGDGSIYPTYKITAINSMD